MPGGNKVLQIKFPLFGDGVIEIAVQEDGNYDFEYDQIAGLGEVMSTKIVSAYLSYSGIKSKWVDARKLILTNNKYRDHFSSFPYLRKRDGDECNFYEILSNIDISASRSSCNGIKNLRRNVSIVTKVVLST